MGQRCIRSIDSRVLSTPFSVVGGITNLLVDDVSSIPSELKS